MKIYDFWIYKNLLNTTPFLWTLVVIIIAFNLISIFVAMFILRDKKKNPSNNGEVQNQS